MDPPLEANSFDVSGPDVEQAAKLLQKAADLGVKIMGLRFDAIQQVKLFCGSAQ